MSNYTSEVFLEHAAYATAIANALRSPAFLDAMTPWNGALGFEIRILEDAEDTGLRVVFNEHGTLSLAVADADAVEPTA